MFTVKKVRFKNFRSYGNSFTEVDLLRSTSTVITAPNGSGKSSVLMAIEFGLFGKVSNGINKNDLVNTINKRDCVVEVECETNGREILIRRGIKPAIFEIFIDGVMVDQDAATRDYQSKFEEEILGFNIASFRQVVSISGGSYTPFLLLSAGNRRKIVEELLNLTVFSSMYSIHLANVAQNRENLQATESEIGRLKASLQSLKKGLDQLASQEDGYRKTVEGNIEKANARVEAIRADIESMSAKVESLQPFVEKHKKRIAKRDKLKTYRRDMERRITQIDESVKFLNENDHCPTCKQAIGDQHRHDCNTPRLAKKEELVKSLGELETIMDQTKADIEELEKALGQIADLEKRIHGEGRRITDLQGYISEQQKLLTQKSDGGATLKAEIRKTVENVENLSAHRLDLLEDKQYNDVIAAIIKDNGIKSKIIAQYVPRMNQEINRFLQILNLNLSFEINESFEERILSRFKDELSYSSFSAGERARIDIAILFTWRELAKLKNSLSCNLLFLDEIFDSVLDDEGLDAFINLLRYSLKDTNVFLISHRPEVVDKFESNMRIGKSGNFSHIEQ